MTRAAVLRDPTTPTGMGQFGVIQAVAPSLRMEVNPVNVRDAGDIERAVTAFARTPNGGLIVPASGSAQRLRDLIIMLAARHKLPAVYWEGLFVTAGGLISYGPSQIEQYRQAAGYVDRILKGEKPADLPVQAPTKYELSSTSRPPRHSASSAGVRAGPRRRGDRIKELRDGWSLMALSGHGSPGSRCPLSGVKRTSASDCRASAIYENTAP